MVNTFEFVTNQPANISVSSSGDNTAIEGVADKAIKVHKIALTFASTVNVTIKDSEGNVMGVYQDVIGLDLGEADECSKLFVTAPDASLVINLSSAVACKGTIWYSQYRVAV